MRALVAGGTGRLGSLLVERLAHAGVALRVLTRDPRRAEHLPGVDLEVVRGDVRLPHTVRAALDGVDVVVSAVHGFAGPGRVTPASVDRDGNAHLVAAARTVGAAFVMVSIVGAAPDSPMELLRHKYAAEQVVRSSGPAYTIVRATAFLELWAELVARGLVLGEGNNPVNLVAVADVADLVTTIVFDSSFRGRTIEIGGPADLSFNDLAALSLELTGRPTRVRHLPRAVLRTLAPLHRMPRAALVMDTTDMTYRPGPASRIGPTHPEVALARTVPLARTVQGSPRHDRA